MLEACAEGDFSLLKELLLINSDINIKNSLGWTALSVAVYNHRYEIVCFLLDNGADINNVNINGTTILMYAKTKVFENRNFEFIEYLLDKGAPLNIRDTKSNFTVLDYIKETGDSEMIDFFKQKGAI